MNIQKELEKLSDRKRAEGEKKYHKSPLKHYGVTSPQLDKLTKQWLKENKDLSMSQIMQCTNKLWSSEWHEERSLAVNILSERRKDLSLKYLPDLEQMVRTTTGWAHLDFIASSLVGELYEQDPERMSQVFRTWIKDQNFWVRRAALLGQLKPLREGRGDFALFEELSAPRLTEKEFFIRKAIGWVLRERAKKVPQDTFNFVSKYQSQMSGLTYREATRRLPIEWQNKLPKRAVPTTGH